MTKSAGIGASAGYSTVELDFSSLKSFYENDSVFVIALLALREIHLKRNKIYTIKIFS
jgi:hypothetical protein